MISDLYARLRPNLRRALMLLLTLATMGLPLYAMPEQSAEHAARPEPEATVPRAAVPARQELTVDEILSRHYEAIGGDGFQRVQTMKMTGTSVVMGNEAPYARFTKRPNKVLLEIYVQDMTGIQAFDGETAWGYMPFLGQMSPAVMTPEQTRNTLEGADFDGPLAHARENGHRVELLGTEPVNGRDAYKLRLTLKTGGVQTLYVDAETFYVTRSQSASGEAVMRDFRLFDGHPVPSVIEMMGPMGEQIVYINDVELGVVIDDAAFRMR